MRKNITTSIATLPVCIVIAAVLWLYRAPFTLEKLTALALTVGISLAIAEWNNRTTLLRVRSRMVSSTYILLMAFVPWLHYMSNDIYAVALFLTAYYIISKTYHEIHTQGLSFYVYLFMGIGTVILPGMWWLVLVFFVTQIIFLRSVTFKSFFATLLALIVPYWTLLAYTYITKNSLFYYDWAAIVQFQPEMFMQQPTVKLVTLALVLFLVFCGTLHFLNNYYADKIRVRMVYYIIILQELTLLALLILQPAHFDAYMRLLLFNSAPILAHYYTLTKGFMIREIWMTVCLVLFLLIGLLNYLTPWITFFKF